MPTTAKTNKPSKYWMKNKILIRQIQRICTLSEIQFKNFTDQQQNNDGKVIVIDMS